MILVDAALEKRAREGRPARVAMVGAGYMGRAIALQICKYVQGMELVVISNRTLEGAERAYREADVKDVQAVSGVAELEDRVARGLPSVTDDPALACRAGGIDAVIEVTGTVQFAAEVILDAIRHGKHTVAMNAEVDGTVGPILKTYADRAGVVFTNAEGDQAGVIMNLYRFVRGMGVRPVLCGNIKGLHDPYRNPTTQEGFARTWGQKVHMVTSAADGTKISFEQAIVANATGMRVARRGMFGPTVETGTRVEDIAGVFPLEDMLEGPGIVDYVVGADPAPGVFVLGTQDHPRQQHYLKYYKLGEGPIYCFHTPFHLCHFEVPNTVARAVLFADAAIAPAGGPRVDVVATAKRDMEAGEVLDAMGGYTTYGLAENSQVVHGEALLPIGLAEGCRLVRPKKKDEVISYRDVEVPEGRPADRLRAEQDERFFGAGVAALTASSAGGAR